MADLVTRFPGLVIEEGKIRAEVQSLFSALKSRISKGWDVGGAMQKRMLGCRYEFTSQVPYYSDFA